MPLRIRWQCLIGRVFHKDLHQTTAFLGRGWRIRDRFHGGRGGVPAAPGRGQEDRERQGRDPNEGMNGPVMHKKRDWFFWPAERHTTDPKRKNLPTALKGAEEGLCSERIKPPLPSDAEGHRLKATKHVF